MFIDLGNTSEDEKSSDSDSSLLEIAAGDEAQPLYFRSNLLEEGMFTRDPFKQEAQKRAKGRQPVGDASVDETR